MSQKGYTGRLAINIIKLYTYNGCLVDARGTHICKLDCDIINEPHGELIQATIWDDGDNGRTKRYKEIIERNLSYYEPIYLKHCYSNNWILDTDEKIIRKNSLEFLFLEYYSLDYVRLGSKIKEDEISVHVESESVQYKKDGISAHQGSESIPRKDDGDEELDRQITTLLQGL